MLASKRHFYPKIFFFLIKGIKQKSGIRKQES